MTAVTSVLLSFAMEIPAPFVRHFREGLHRFPGDLKPMHDHLSRHLSRCQARLCRKTVGAGVSAGFITVFAAFGLVLSAFLFVDSVRAASGQEPAQSQSQAPIPPAPGPGAAQQPATADEGTFGGTPGTTAATPTVAPWMTVPPTDYHKHVASKYNYAFGKDTPFLPSKATSYNGEFMSPKSFPTAQYCGHCHQESYRQWRQSAHSNSFRAPWYLKNVNMLIDEKGVQFSRHCEGCHNPVALLSGDLSQGMPRKRPFEDEGLTCMTCHAITSTTTYGTGSYVMGIPAVMVDETGQPITHPVPDSEILAHLGVLRSLPQS
jgi:hypothetical protein